MTTTAKDVARTSERFRRLGVACLEADWSSRLDNTQSVVPLLELSERQGWIRFLHRRIRDQQDLLDDLNRLSSQVSYRRYRLLYVASHGTEGALSVGGPIPLAELHGLDLRDRVLYLGGCSIGASRALKEFKELRRATRARAVCGYVHDVDWDESAAFELLLLSWLAFETRSWPLEALRQTGETYKGLARLLGFVAVWRGGQWPSPSPRRQSSG